MAAPARVVLRRKLSRALAAGHPWVYRDAVDGDPGPPGTVVDVVDRRGRLVARGLAEAGPIAVRVWTTREERLDAGLVTRRLTAAATLRDRVLAGEGGETDCLRLLHGEGDRVPGLTCDVYGTLATAAVDGAAMTARRDLWEGPLSTWLQDRGVQTLLLRTGKRHAREVERVFGPAPPERLVVRERGLRLCLDPVRGQKTGLFLDHRPGRARVRSLAAGARVLDLYSYVGGFSAAAGLGGAAQVHSVDVAKGAIAMAQATWAANDLDASHHVATVADVPQRLAELAEGGERFDLIIADPPSFAPNAAAVPGALESYRKLHRASLGLLREGGLLLAATCSSHVDAAAFEGVLAEAASQARRVVQVLERWGAPADHPRLLAFPEGDYLHCVLAVSGGR